MTTRLRINTIVFAVVAACAENDGRATSAEARRRVSEFYAWYVPIARKSGDASMRAIRERSAAFDARIVTGLRADSIARAGKRSEIIGLDGDPFLYAQDPCDRYDAVSASQEGQVYLVSVLGSGGCKPHEKPDVVVEVTRQNGRLVFANFRYSSARADNLLDLLARQRDARARP